MILVCTMHYALPGLWARGGRGGEEMVDGMMGWDYDGTEMSAFS